MRKFVGSNHHAIDLDFKPKNSTPLDKKTGGAANLRKNGDFAVIKC